MFLNETFWGDFQTQCLFEEQIRAKIQGLVLVRTKKYLNRHVTASVLTTTTTKKEVRDEKSHN